MEIDKIKEISDVAVLLDEYSLPTSDLQKNNTVELFGVYYNENLSACVGVEIYGKTALLRSMAVSSGFRKKGVGKKLVEFIENYTIQKGVKEIYLLTETADKFFKKAGYTITSREGAPLIIRGTTQFSELCPGSSKCMIKILDGKL